MSKLYVTTTPPPDPFSLSASIRLPILSSLCSERGHELYGLYPFSRCNPFVHIDYAMNEWNIKDKILLDIEEKENEDLESNQSVDLIAFKVKSIKLGEDRTEIDTKIEHFNHKHHLQLYDYGVLNNEKCDGCIQAILPPFYCCVKCSFFLHKSCAQLPRKKWHPLHQHPLTLLLINVLWKTFFWCHACDHPCNGFTYTCEICVFYLDVHCSLVSDILTHESHKHQLILSNTSYEQSCSSCGSKSNQVCCCTIFEFALDFKCAKLPHTARYKQYEHPFTLYNIAKVDCNEYCCDIVKINETQTIGSTTV